MIPDWTLLIILCVIGLSTGVLSGFFGVGGAFILTPVLNILFLPVTEAIVTSLAFTVAVSLLGGFNHYRAGNVSINVFIFVSLSSLVGVSISKPLMIYLKEINLADIYFQLSFIFLLFIMGLITYFKKITQEPERGSSAILSFLNKVPPYVNSQEHNSQSIWHHGLEKLVPRIREKSIVVTGFIKSVPPYIKVDQAKKVSLWSLISIGLFVGFLKGFLGVGGGFMLVPLLIFLLDMEMHKAIGTSLAVLFVSSVYATGLYLTSVNIQLLIVAALVLGASVGVRYGIKALSKVGNEKLKEHYAVFLLLSAVGILLNYLQLSNVSVAYMVLLLLITSSFIFCRYCLKPNVNEGKLF